MPPEKLEGVIEKYLFNIKERKLYKLIHLKVDLDNTILPFQQNSIVSLDLFKALFIGFVQRVSDQEFPVRRSVIKNSLESLAREEKFFECKDPNILILIVRLNFDYLNSLENYNLINIINCVNIVDFNFLREWRDNFYQSNLDLERYNNYILWLKNNLNNLEFNFIKIFLQEDLKYIEDIVLELRHPSLQVVEQKAIRNFNNINYDLFQLADKTNLLYPGIENSNISETLWEESNIKKEESNSSHPLD
jgi:hypothetical protein